MTNLESPAPATTVTSVPTPQPLTFADIRNDLQPGDLLLVGQIKFDGAGLAIRLANFFRRGYRDRYWTHVAIYVGDGQVVEAFPTGIVQRSVDEAYGKGYRIIHLRRHEKQSAEAIANQINFVKKEVGSQYDMRAVVYFLMYVLTPVQLHFILDDPKVERVFNVSEAFFCSELVASALYLSGGYCFDRAPSKVMPIDFDCHYVFEQRHRLEPDKYVGFWGRVGRTMGMVVGFPLYLAMALAASILSVALVILMGVLAAVVAVAAFALVVVTFGALLPKNKTTK